ncbi:MAG: S8 family serine peptidase, partial [Chloroflexota bacterium]|nr:S8 family serine peptidase [Chloroflexota bacterium]
MNQPLLRTRVVAVVSAAAFVASIGLASTGRFDAVSAAGPVPAHAVVDPALEALLGRLGPTDRVRVVATMRDQVDPRAIRSFDRRQQRRDLVVALRGKADTTQAGVRAALVGRPAGQVTAVTALWIVNAVAVTATPGVVRELAARSDVARISAESTIAAPEPEVVPLTAGVEPNLDQISAPAMWALGFQGSGAVIASFDTGVDLTNPDLAATWRGGANSWFDPYGQHPSTPADLNGHGSQTLGIAVGGSDGGTAIGVAPGARWIAAKIFNDSGVATSTGIHQAFQWVLDPDGNPATDDAPDVVNNSWGVGTPMCDLSYAPDVAVLISAGIVPVFAAGNYGPGGASSVSPANGPGSFSVGAVDGSDTIASFSSLGPTDCGRSSPTTFPSVVAPGVSIRTSTRFGLYGSGSGTSYSAPHVSGAIALLRGAVPGATVDQLELALVGSAVDLGPPGADDTFGAGRIDVRSAYDDLLAQPAPTPTASPIPTPTAAPIPTPGSDLDGPLAGAPVIAPDPANGSTSVVVSAVVDDGPTGGSAIQAAELWVDAVGPVGSGTAMSVASDGGPLATATGSLSTIALAGLADGVHTVSVRAMDSPGNWGPVSSGSLIIDRSGPTIADGQGTPDPTQGGSSIAIQALASDPAASTILAAEWFSGSDPGAGNGAAMDPVDGAFDGSVESVASSLPAGATFGEHVISVRAQDAAGNWGPASLVSYLITPADGIFADGFESGTLTRWRSVTGSSRLKVKTSAAAGGRLGLSASLRGSLPAFVTDASPVAETAYHARFTVDANRTSTRGRAIRLFAGRDRHG